MKERGFTVVELVIVITVMAILLILAMVNVRSSQVQARDNERRVDVENIARALESYYDQQQSDGRQRTYPGLNAARTALEPTDYIGGFLRERTGQGSLYAPGVEENTSDTLANTSVRPATNNDQRPANVRPEVTISTYVYQPLTADNALCIHSAGVTCTKFNIFYKTERSTDGCTASPENICVFRSRRQ